MTNNTSNKVIYLKSLVKNYKPKVDTFPKDILKELEELGIDLIRLINSLFGEQFIHLLRW